MRVRSIDGRSDVRSTNRRGNVRSFGRRGDVRSTDRRGDVRRRRLWYARGRRDHSARWRVQKMSGRSDFNALGRLRGRRLELPDLHSG